MENSFGDLSDRFMQIWKKLGHFLTFFMYDGHFGEYVRLVIIFSVLCSFIPIEQLLEERPNFRLVAEFPKGR